jgi:DNA-binding Lrp family transcriptional regulator
MSEHESKEKALSRSKTKRTKKPFKDVELRLISELMKNSRRSDRELARTIGISQPTVTRLRRQLEKKGVIKEYTMIPDFRMLGYQLMGATRLGINEPYSKERFEEIRKATLEMERNNPNAFLLGVNGFSQNANRLFITFYENYSDYVHAMELTKQVPFTNIETIDTFLVDLNDETNYRVLGMSAIANHLLQRLKKKVPSHE